MVYVCHKSLLHECFKANLELVKYSVLVLIRYECLQVRRSHKCLTGSTVKSTMYEVTYHIL